jgi:hypothetical protein
VTTDAAEETEIQELEATIARLDEVLLHLPDAMVEIELDTLLVVTANWMARLHMGLPLDESPSGLRALDFLDPPEVERALEIIEATVGESRRTRAPFAGLAEPLIVELNMRRRDGSTFIAECQGHFLVDTEGIPERLMVTFTDITARRAAEAERALLLARLRAAAGQVRTLQGLLPICAVCKNVRDDHGYWVQIESYIRRSTDADFSHGLCPSCRAEVYPGVHIPD